MNKTAGYIYCHPTHTYYLKGKLTMAICVSGTSTSRFKLAVSTAMDEKKIAFISYIQGTGWRKRGTKSAFDTSEWIVWICAA